MTLFENVIAYLRHMRISQYAVLPGGATALSAEAISPREKKEKRKNELMN